MTLLFLSVMKMVAIEIVTVRIIRQELVVVRLMAVEERD